MSFCLDLTLSRVEGGRLLNTTSYKAVKNSYHGGWKKAEEAEEISKISLAAGRYSSTHLFTFFANIRFSFYNGR